MPATPPSHPYLRVENGPKDATELRVIGRSSIDGCEASADALREVVPAATRRRHGSKQLHVLDMFHFTLGAVIPGSGYERRMVTAQGMV